MMKSQTEHDDVSHWEEAVALALAEDDFRTLETIDRLWTRWNRYYIAYRRHDRIARLRRRNRRQLCMQAP